MIKGIKKGRGQLVITGATSGIGQQTVIEFAKKGWDICLISRSESKLEKMVSRLKEINTHIKLSYICLDLSSTQAIKDVANQFSNHLDHIDILVNNAGAIFGELGYTDEGMERTFALNHMGYFTLTHYLIKLLLKGTDPQIINVASLAHTFVSKIDWDDIYFSKRPYKQLTVYGQSKLFNIYFTQYLANQLRGHIRVNALHPGTIRTGFGQSGSPFFAKLVRVGAPFLSKPHKASKAILQIALSEKYNNETGTYFDKLSIGRLSSLAKKSDQAEKLWNLSMQLSGITNYFKDIQN